MIVEYNYKAADNDDTEIAQGIIKTVIQEYNLYACGVPVEKDLIDIEGSYKNGFFGIFLDVEEPIGNFGLFPLGEGVAEIRKMYLLPKARGKGIGKWMVRFLLKKAKELNYNRVELETASQLKEAISLYQKLGFQEIKNNNSNSSCDRAFFMEI